MKYRSILRFIDHHYQLKKLFTTSRNVMEWFTQNPPQEDSEWPEVRLWMAIRSEIEAKRVIVPGDLREEVAGVMVAHRLERPVPRVR
ncbi:MAG: hypothetical protein ABSD38_10590 [Syntrophorhabdales bacterium]|jgi:hypothetical protein